MAASPTPARLRVSRRSALLAVAMLGFTLAALRLVAASGRVIGWVLTAAIVAGLLYPLVDLLRRRMPRGVAVAVVVILTLVVAVTVMSAVVDDVVDERAALVEAVPDAARELERSERFGDAARDFRLAERAEEFVRELPERLRGGSVQDALRSAATRGVAFLATGVLSVFFLVHGPRLLAGAVRQLTPERRAQARAVGLAVYRRSWNYVAGSLGMALASGLLVYVCAVVTDAPGPAPLALWMGLLDLVPLVGVVVGALPLVLLVAADSVGEAVAVGVVLLVWQLVEAFVVQRWVEDRSVHLGAFLTVAVGMIGVEIYGIGGALVGLVLAVVVANAISEWYAEAEAALTGTVPAGGEALHRQG